MIAEEAYVGLNGCKPAGLLAKPVVSCVVFVDVLASWLLMLLVLQGPLLRNHFPLDGDGVMALVLSLCC